MNKPATFDDAYRILDQAIAEQPRREFGSLLSSEMRFVKAILADDTSVILAELSRGKTEFAALTKDVAVIVDEQVRRNPALYIGGFAVAAFAVGLLASASHYHKETA